MIGTSWGLPTPEPWTADAICQQTDPEAFFPEKGESRRMRAAKLVCASCPVTAACLAYALRNNERFGVWGGLSERERRRMLRARPRDTVERVGCGDAIGTEAGYMRHRRRREASCTACRAAATLAGSLRKAERPAS